MLNKKTDNINNSSDLEKIPKESFPNHVLIIPDGDGRWAKRYNKIPAFGHKRGFVVLKRIIRKLEELPIDILTIWGFSADNWKRSNKEVEALMKLFEVGINEMFPELIEKNIRFICLGRKDRIPDSLKNTIKKVERETSGNGPKIFCIAIDFSGLDQEIRMMKKVRGLPNNTKVDIDLITKLRDGGGIIPPADLIVRTSGEQRVSDLGWLSINSEFYSIKKYLPDTTPDDFILALIDYAKRERRFGGRLK